MTAIAAESVVTQRHTMYRTNIRRVLGVPSILKPSKIAPLAVTVYLLLRRCRLAAVIHRPEA